MDSAPFDDIRALLGRCPPPHDEAADELLARITASGALSPSGEAAELAAWLARWSGRPEPDIRKPLVAIFAASHGIAAHGVSLRSAADIADMVQRCQTGTGAINRLCTQFDLGLKVFDLALDMPTADFTVGPALDERHCAATMAFGMEALAEGADLLCLGAFGAGGATASAAILCAIHGGQASEWVAATNPGIDARRHAAVQAALTVHGAHLGDPLQVLARLGGREFAALAGAVVAARFQSVPVLLDGPAALTAALALHRASPGAAAHCRLAAPAQTAKLQEVAAEAGLTPILARSFGSLAQEPLDGATGMAVVKAAGSLAG